MATTLFLLPTELRQQIYALIFADAHSTFDFNNDVSLKSDQPVRKRSFTVFSQGEISFLQASKQCYHDAIDSYREARSLCIRSLRKESIEDFTALSHVLTNAKVVEFDDIGISGFSNIPSFPRIQRLVLNGVKMWGGSMVVERGQTALEAFNDSHALQCLFNNVRYSSLKVEERISKYFPSAHIVVNFRIGHQVLDKNLMRGIQDWDWACSYDVKSDKLEKTLAHRLVFW